MFMEKKQFENRNFPIKIAPFAFIENSGFKRKEQQQKNSINFFPREKKLLTEPLIEK